MKSCIIYGTFNKLCEDLINEKGDVRDLVEAILTGRSIDSIIKTPDNRPKILLIDEVDVFFSPTFYGKTYDPIALLKDETISKLIRYAWKVRLDPQKLRYLNFVQSAEYLAYIKRFDAWKELMAESAKLMLVELRNFIHPKAIHNYVKTANGIAYTVQDGISDKKFEGFQQFSRISKSLKLKIPSASFLSPSWLKCSGYPFIWAASPTPKSRSYTKRSWVYPELSCSSEKSKGVLSRVRMVIRLESSLTCHQHTVSQNGRFKIRSF